jgi:hypothetical protein
MKRIFLSMTLLFVACISYSQNVNIPDANFKNALISAGVDTNEDGEISYAEAAVIKKLDVHEMNISDMTGIEEFIFLDTLYCYGNQITNLDVSNCLSLISLWCGNNQLASLDVSHNIALEDLRCHLNQLASLDVSGLISLKVLICFGNQLTSLNISNNTALEYFDCSINQLTSVDVSHNTSLMYLLCSINQLTSLEVSNYTALKEFYCFSNQLTSLDVSNDTALTLLRCDDNQLTSLDVSGCIALTHLECGGNQLASLDISNNIKITYLNLNVIPTLYKVCVWEIPFPPAGTYVESLNSPNVYFTTDCTATSLNSDKVNSRINIYPNPAKEYMVFDITNISSSATVELFDIQGKKVLEQKLPENRQVSVSSLPKGLYLYRLNDRDNIYKGKITLE